MVKSWYLVNKTERSILTTNNTFAPFSKITSACRPKTFFVLEDCLHAKKIYTPTFPGKKLVVYNEENLMTAYKMSVVQSILNPVSLPQKENETVDPPSISTQPIPENPDYDLLQITQPDESGTPVNANEKDPDKIGLAANVAETCDTPFILEAMDTLQRMVHLMELIQQKEKSLRFL